MIPRNIKIIAWAIALVVAIGVANAAMASSTISTDITTGGNLNVSGTATLNNLTVTGSTTLSGNFSATIIPLQDTAANLSSVIPATGQMVYETDTKYSKVGDGLTAIGSLNPLIFNNWTATLNAYAFNAASTSATSTFSGNMIMSNGSNVTAANNSFAYGQTAGASYKMAATGIGSFAHGNIANIGGATGGTMTASGKGSTACGVTNSTGGTAGQILAIGDGSFACGGTTGNNTIQATGTASFALGLASLGSMTATANGAFALGNAVNVSGINSFAIGTTFTNSAASTFQVGYGSAELTVNATGIGIGTSTPAALLDVTSSTASATTTVALGNNSAATKGTCIKLLRTDGTPVYAYVAAGATTFTLSTTACASVSNF